MDWGFVFFFNSILLGAGLAMDAFSVSLANGLGEPDMRVGRMSGIAGTFALFQAVMPLIGWICVHTVVVYFESFERFIPWIALALLGYIGGKMLIEGIRSRGERPRGENPHGENSRGENSHGENSRGENSRGENSHGENSRGEVKPRKSAARLTLSALMVQGVATSIDALSVGFTIADYDLAMAIVCALIIAIVTFIICMLGLYLGRVFGTRLAGKAGILGGVILIIIGLEIFIKGVFFA